MKYLSILQDSLRETLDRKSLYVLLSVSTLIILACLCVGYEQVELHETVKDMVEDFSRDHRFFGTQYHVRTFDVQFAVSDVASVGSDADAMEFEGGATFRLAASPLAGFQKLVLYHRAVSEGKMGKGGDPIPGLDAEQSKVVEPPDDAAMTRFFKAKLAALNLTRTRIVFEGVDGDAARFRIWFRPSRFDSLIAGHRLSILFGKWKVPLRDASVGDVVFNIQKQMANLIAGWAGLLVAIVSTANFIPNMMQKGTLDLVLSKPIRRPSLLLYKYLGGLTYVLLNAVYLIGGTWAALAARSGMWDPGYLMTIPLLLFFFSALYAVSTLFSVLTRSPIVGIMTAVLVWFGLFVIGTANDIVHQPGLNPPQWAFTLVDTLHTVLPPLDQTDKAVERTLAAANGITAERYQQLYLRPLPKVRWDLLFGVTGAWMTALLALACWRFSRRDY